MKLTTSINFSDNHGFTLAEMMVVIAIIGIITTFLIISFPRTHINLSESTNLVSSAIRSAQSSAISSARFNNQVPCGYGFHYVDPTHFLVYTGPNASSNNCSTINRNYDSSVDSIVSQQTFTSNQVEFKSSFNDIYFEPPDPKTYLNNIYDPTQQKESITVGIVGASCPANCQSIYVYPSGNIDVQ